MMKSWFNTHIQAIKLVLLRMRNNLLSTLLIALAVGVAMCLPGLFYLSVDHISQFSTVMQNENEISIFLDLDANKTTISEINTVLSNHPQIKQHRLVNKDEAWTTLKSKTSQNNTSTELLDENPLPDAFYIQANSSDPEALESLKKDLQQIPKVDHVLLNTDWSKRLAAILAIAKKIIFFIALLLAIALIVIIGNTIRMQILTQQDEIEVSYLIGATNSFIRTPFLYAGMLYGLLGGLVGITIIAFSVNRFNHYVTSLSNLYNSDFSLALFNVDLLVAIIVAAVVIGWLGAYLAVNRAIATMVASQKNH